MSGYVNRGPDPRILGEWAGHVQSALSFKAQPEPLQVLIAFPFFLSIAVPYYWKGWKYATLRIGWRFDKYWRGYIADVIVKLKRTDVVHY